MTLAQKFQNTLKQYETDLADTQKSYLPVLTQAIESLNDSGDFKVKLLLAQYGAVTLSAKQPNWREDRLVTLTEDALDKIFRADPVNAVDNMAETIVTELAHTLARSQQSAKIKYLLGR